MRGIIETIALAMAISMCPILFIGWVVATIMDAIKGRYPWN